MSPADLTAEQKEAIERWASEGATLGEIQKRLDEEFEIGMTFLDSRLLLADLGVSLKGEEKEPEPEEAPVAEEADAGPGDAVAGEEGVGKPADAGEAAVAGGVTVTLDEITPPDVVAAGKVTFSDGETATWYFDQLGRLGVDPSKEDYRPSDADVEAFQQQLQKLAAEQGL